jgi:hypothetical protein
MSTIEDLFPARGDPTSPSATPNGPKTTGYVGPAARPPPRQVPILQFYYVDTLGLLPAGRAGSPLRGLGELGSPLGIFRNCTSLLLVLRDHLAGGSEHLYLAVA